MNYNIHPIFVHFPIALLFVYSLIKILPLKRWVPSIAWKDIEQLLLLIGVFGAFAGLATGETAEHLVRPNHQLVEMHSTFAALSTWIYGLLLAGEALDMGIPWISKKVQFPTLLGLLTRIKHILTNPFVTITLAIVGLIAISITGMLGGIITYGVAADPIAPLLVKTLGITL
jgi:uncharacterized membrane protein